MKWTESSVVDNARIVGIERSCLYGNVGSGTVQEMQQWVEYITFAGTSPMADLRRQNARDEPRTLPYVGVGNENWGCGGIMGRQTSGASCAALRQMR